LPKIVELFSFDFFSLGKKGEPKPPPPPSTVSMVEKVIKRLIEVPGMTNDSQRWYLDKASVYVRFKDGSGNLRLFINTLKVPHVYIFDRKNVCHFGGYVGWFHLEALKEVISGIKEEFDEDSAK
jgi:hypothetical protein